MHEEFNPDRLDELDEYWTDEEVAAYLGIKVDSVSAWVSRHPEVDRRPRMKASKVVAAKLASPGKSWRRGKKQTNRDGTHNVRGTGEGQG